MRDYDGCLSFDPRPVDMEYTGLRFPLTCRGQRLVVDIGGETTTYLLEEGSELVIKHRGEEIKLSVGVPVSVR